MKFGMPTLIELNSIEENVRLCKDLGLDFVELNMNMSYCLPERNDIQRLNQLSRDYHIDFTMHFPEEIDFGTPFEVIKKANIELFKELSEFGSQIKVKKINLHLLPGTVVTLPQRKVFPYEVDLDLFHHNLFDSLEKVSSIAKSQETEVCMENVNVPEFLKGTINQLSQMDTINFTYDIGHDAKGNYYVTKLYKELGKKVTHMHFHDYDGKTDHQVLFKGQIDLIDRLNMAKENDMTVVIEVKTKEALMESVNELRKRNLF